MISIVDLYAASTAGVLILLFIPSASRWATAFLPSIRFLMLNRAAFPLLIQRRRGWPGVTRLEFALLLLYVGVNIACLFKDGTSGLVGRSGQMSSVNMVTLMLGGRTNVLVDVCGIPLHVYYLAHHWIGRMATTQALLHVGLAMAAGWTRDRDTISGLVVRIPCATSAALTLDRPPCPLL